MLECETVPLESSTKAVEQICRWLDPSIAHRTVICCCSSSSQSTPSIMRSRPPQTGETRGDTVYPRIIQSYQYHKITKSSKTGDENLDIIYVCKFIITTRN